MRSLSLSCTFAALLLCVLADTHTATPTSAPNATNYNCPEDCECVMAAPHKPLLHAHCSSLQGLKAEAPLQMTLPIHSIDLSHLGLTRLSHSFEKLRDLVNIDLSHNELHEIGHLGRRIKKLNLKHNHITSGKLTRLPHHVETLNLQHNDITYLPLEFTRLMQLKNLELSNNHINCSCETLDVRNWLQERHVYMSHPVTCSYPAEMKGKPWLQVKQSDICDREDHGLFADDDENELMMGDQPVEGSGDKDDDEDELGKAFMPIDKASTPKTNDHKFSDVEGSGDLSIMNLPLQAETAALHSAIDDDAITEVTHNQDDDEGSGSGGGLLIIPEITKKVLSDLQGALHDDDEYGRSLDHDADSRPVDQPEPAATESPVTFGIGMGIFDGVEKGATHTDAPGKDENAVPVIHHHVEIEAAGDAVVSTDAAVASDSTVDHENIKTAKVGDSEDSNATYFLLGVVGLIIVGLILFVGIKRCKNNRNNHHDAENPRQTELLDMDKKQLGKPVHHNGTEQAPLIGEKSKSDIAKPISGNKPYSPNDVKDGPAQGQPLLNGNGNSGTNGKQATDPYDDIQKEKATTNELSPHEYYPITPRYPTPKSPRASKYAQYPPSEQNNNNLSNTDNANLPSSPKSGRYSPVYSPETGRVKIKLTETPKPKTPMLVTRSKSNAGEIITTPVNALHAVPPVGNANGRVDY